MTMANTETISYFYDIFSRLGPFTKDKTPDSSDESETQGTGEVILLIMFALVEVEQVSYK